MTLERSYELAANPPRPLAWEEYERSVQSQWQALLASAPPPSEKTVQAFLEQHPCMVPFPLSPGTPSGHYPLWAALITQPVLPDLHYRKPDFMWLATDSMCLYPVLIEIEAPAKRWFTTRGTPTTGFSQAYQQLAQWRTWFNQPGNKESFLAHYQVERLITRSRAIHPIYVLVYGRRKEAIQEPRFASQRDAMHREDEYLMTYDRLSPDRDADQLWTIRGEPDHWQAVSIPPTTMLGPRLAEERACISNREEAISSNPLIAKERANFLIKRLPYWDRWASTEGASMTNAANWE